MRGKPRLWPVCPERPPCTPARASGAAYPAGTVEKSSALGESRTTRPDNPRLAVARGGESLASSCFRGRWSKSSRSGICRRGVRHGEHRVDRVGAAREHSFRRMVGPIRGWVCTPYAGRRPDAIYRCFPHTASWRISPFTLQPIRRSRVDCAPASRGMPPLNPDSSSFCPRRRPVRPSP